MKKILKVLATTAALASVIPFHAEGDERKGTVKALLWKVKWDIDPDYQSQSDINVTIGFNNPFKKEDKEAHLFADELVVDYCCDSTLAHDCAQTPDCCCGEEKTADEESCTCGGDCQCGGDCDCGEGECQCSGDCDCGCHEEKDASGDCGCTE